MPVSLCRWRDWSLKGMLHYGMRYPGSRQTSASEGSLRHRPTQSDPGFKHAWRYNWYWLSCLCSVLVLFRYAVDFKNVCVFSGDCTLLCGYRRHFRGSDESAEAVWGYDHQLQAQHRQAGGRSPIYPGVTHIRQQTHQIHHGGASLYMLSSHILLHAY